MSDPRQHLTAEDLIAGESELAGALEQLLLKIQGHQKDFFLALDEALTNRVAAAFSRAAEAHRQLLEAAGLTEQGGKPDAVLLPEDSGVGEVQRTDSEGPGPQGIAKGARLRGFRQGVRDRVLEPLRNDLRDLEIGKTLAERWIGFQNRLPLLVEDLPDVIHRPEPEDLYGSLSTDTGATALRKALVRGGRGLRSLPYSAWSGVLRLFGRPPAPTKANIQHVRLRPAARECLLGRCPLSVEPLVEDLQQHYAAPVSRLESAVADWTEAWFGVEEEVQRAEGTLGVRFLQELSIGATESTVEISDPETDSDTDSDATDENPESPAVEPGVEPREVCRGLSEALALGASLGSPTSVWARVEETMRGEWSFFLEKIRVSGSFQEPSGGRRAEAQIRRAMEKSAARARDWEAWHGSSLGRVTMGILLLRLREDFDDAENLLLGGIVDGALSPIGEALKKSWSGMKGLLRLAESELTAAAESSEPDPMLRLVEELSDRALSLVQPSLPDLFADSNPSAAIGAVADSVAGKLSESLRFLPEAVTVTSSQGEAGPVVPTLATRTVPFRESAQRAVDVLRLEAIRNSPGPLKEYLVAVAEECREIPNIVSYNFSAAREELESSEDSPTSAPEGARTLVLDGLGRTARGIEELLDGLGKSWREFTCDAHELFQEGFREIHSRSVAEGAVQEQILDFRTVVRSWARSALGKLRIWLQGGGRRLSRLFRKAWIRGARLIRLGRTAVGEAGSTEEEAERAREVLRGIPALLQSLPLVYRRLFSFQPLSDSALLVGREKETDWIRGRVEAWNSGVFVPCVVTGPVGVGHTSFLNALTTTEFRDFPVFRLVLDRRIGAEEELAALLGKTLGLEGDPTNSLDGVAHELLEGEEARGGMVVLTEHLEHLLLRRPGGTDLLEKFLTFQAQTASGVLWLSNTSGATWKIMEKKEPRAVAMLDQYSLPVLSRQATEELIMVRHRRSGLPVEFLQPHDLNPLVRRRLRLARGEKARQQILRAEFFDRVFRMSEGSIAMALLLWLRSADFSSREGWLRVNPPRPVRFSFLDGMDLDLGFALKAFLEHGSLTLEEYGEIFGTTRAEAYQVFEALRTRAVLEPLNASPAQDSRFEGVEDGARYRVPGILSQVAANRLKNRNILH